MPSEASSLALSASSVKCELPPSMTRSPSCSSPASWATVSRVGVPAGTITHTTRGGASERDHLRQARDVARPRG